MTHFPLSWTQSAAAAHWETRLRATQRSVLLLDYDGTLAPFKSDRLQALPYPGVEERLKVLAYSPHVRLVLISGRQAREVQELLNRTGRTAEFEIWGNHGWEHLTADGSRLLRPLPAGDREIMEDVTREIEALGCPRAIEQKDVSVAIHWRGFELAAQQHLRGVVDSLMKRYSGRSSLEFIPFDGGVELRSKTYSKATAVEHVLEQEEHRLPVAYLGDDLTDEDAFGALGDHGVSILVAGEPRESKAAFWIKPPGELLQFLDVWIQASAVRNQR